MTYPRKDWSFDDPIPPRESQIDYVYTQGKVAVDNPVFGRVPGRRELRQIRAYLSRKNRVRLGGKTDTDVTPSTKGEPLLQQNKDRSPAQATLAHECIRDLLAIVLKEQQARRQTAKLPMVQESFPNATGNLDDRWETCKQCLTILNEMRKDQLDTKVNVVVAAVREAAMARAFLRDVVSVQDYLHGKREKDLALEHKYQNKNAKPLSAIVDLNNLSPVREDILGGATTLLGIGASAIAHAYGLDMSPLQSVYRAFRRKRTKARMTVPKAPKPEAPLPHQQEYDELVRRSAERRKARERRAAAGTISIDGT